MPKPMPTAALTLIFGSRTALAAAAGVDRAMLNRWEERQTGLRKRGHIPSRYNPAILRAATAAGLDHSAVVSQLDTHSCPLCGSTLAKDAMIDARLLRRLGNGKS